MKMILPLVIVSLLIQSTSLLRTAHVEVGPGSGEVLIADLDRDGHLDIVTKHLLKQRITVSLGDGGGNFKRGPGSMELEYQPGAIALGDANGDGNPDLAMASRRDATEYAEVRLGNGTGRFAKGAQHRVSGAMPYYKPVVQLIDINEDGRADLVVANGRRNTIQVLAGDGRGGFGAPSSIALESGHDRYHFKLGDINRDGHLDLVSSSSTSGGEGTIAVAVGNGRGQFTRQPAQLAGQGPRVEVLADVNHDGHLDAIASHPAPRLSVLLSDGRGRFRHAAGSPLPLSAQTHAVVAEDLNGDGVIDLAAATADSVTVFLGKGGAFGPAPGSPFRAGPGAYTLSSADLNRDGRKDLAASSFEGSALTLLFGR